MLICVSYFVLANVSDCSKKSITISISLYSAVKCSELEHPMHGEVELKERTFHSKAHYTCNDGFDLVGDEYRTCQASGSWSGNAPFCECK